MGWDEEIFGTEKSQQPGDDYTCNICHLVVSNPHQCPWGHLFCLSCLNKWLEATGDEAQCPVCKNTINWNSISFNRLADDQLERFHVRVCPNQLALDKGEVSLPPLEIWDPETLTCVTVDHSHDDRVTKLCRCNWTGTLHDLQYATRPAEPHDKTCPLRWIECPNKIYGCEWEGPAILMEDEEFSHLKVCSRTPLLCPHEGCHEVICDREEFNRHLREECPWGLVPCPRGCGVSVPRHLLPQHDTLESNSPCPLLKYSCPHQCDQLSEPLTVDQIRHHLSHSCPLHPFPCQLCGEVGPWRSRDHRPWCPKEPQICPYHCGVDNIPRDRLNDHLNSQCPLAWMECPFRCSCLPVPCDCPNMCRRDMMIHLNLPATRDRHHDRLLRYLLPPSTPTSSFPIGGTD